MFKSLLLQLLYLPHNFQAKMMNNSLAEREPGEIFYKIQCLILISIPLMHSVAIVSVRQTYPSVASVHPVLSYCLVVDLAYQDHMNLASVPYQVPVADSCADSFQYQVVLSKIKIFIFWAIQKLQPNMIVKNDHIYSRSCYLV